jgi:hypothetical protein
MWWRVNIPKGNTDVYTRVYFENPRKVATVLIFTVAPCINNIKLFIVQLIHTNCIKLLNY